MSRDSGKRIGRGRRAYASAATILLTALLLFAGVNLLALIVLASVSPAIDPRVADDQARSASPGAYSESQPERVARFLEEQAKLQSLGFVFDPWLEFRHPAFAGELLGTDARGFRRTVTPASRPGPVTDVYVFGGSTVFGFGVPDADSIPSYLQVALEARRPERAFRVSNYGQALYYSSQERALFQRLLLEGGEPELAVFIDGANDVAQLALERDQPFFADRAEAGWRSPASAPPSLAAAAAALPVVRLARRLGLGAAAPRSPRLRELHAALPSDSHARRAEYIVSRYLGNVEIVRAVAAARGVRCLFVWQPVPFHRYPPRLPRDRVYPEGVPAFWGEAYRRMEVHQAADFLYLGNMLDADADAYVDDIHYNEAVNRRLAERIAEAVDARR